MGRRRRGHLNQGRAVEIARLADSGEEYASWCTSRRTARPAYVDAGHGLASRRMAESERGLPLASAVLDELGYRREGTSDVWTMVRRWEA